MARQRSWAFHLSSANPSGLRCDWSPLVHGNVGPSMVFQPPNLNISWIAALINWSPHVTDNVTFPLGRALYSYSLRGVKPGIQMMIKCFSGFTEEVGRGWPILYTMHSFAELTLSRFQSWINHKCAFWISGVKALFVILSDHYAWWLNWNSCATALILFWAWVTPMPCQGLLCAPSPDLASMFYLSGHTHKISLNKSVLQCSEDSI